MRRVDIKKILYICMFLILIVARISNYESFVFGYSPTIIGTIFSCMYYVVWLLILLFTRFKNKSGFTLFAIYWGINFIIGILGYTELAYSISDSITLPLVYVFLIQISGFELEIAYLVALFASLVYLLLGTYKWLKK